MDLILFAVTIVLSAILIIVNILNKIFVTDDLKKIAKAIVFEGNDPKTRAFCLGYSSSDKLAFNNAYIDDTGEVIVREEETGPVISNGDIIDVSNTGSTRHGSIVSHSDGFSVVGILHFTCPSGYKGEHCVPKLPCDPNGSDKGKIKPITYEMFNSLNLFENNWGPSGSSKNNRDNQMTIHPRLKIVCDASEGGEFNIVACGANELLDESTLACKPYDICQDKNYGFKHAFDIGDGNVLGRDEYRICIDNVSEIVKCADGLVFSHDSRGCVFESPCFGTGDAQFEIDSNSYIQCEGDLPKKVECPFGVGTRDDGNQRRYYCKARKTCVPSRQIMSDALFEYAFENVTCDEDDRSHRVTCDSSDSKARFRGSWVENFEVEIPGWPKEIFKNGSCVDAAGDESILKIDSQVNLQWTLLMGESHPFLLRQKQFRCDSNNNNDDTYRWDYIGQKLIRQSDESEVRDVLDRYLVSTGTPCYFGTLPPITDSPWLGIPMMDAYPNAQLPAIIRVDARLPNGISDLSWPIYVSKEKKYRASTFERDLAKGSIRMTIMSAKTPPRGFKTRTDDGKLQLLGYSNFNAVKNNSIWFFMATGPFKTPVFESSGLMIEHDQILEMRQTVDSGRDFSTPNSGYFLVPMPWMNITNEIPARLFKPNQLPRESRRRRNIAVEEKEDREWITVERKGLRFRDQLFPPCLTLMKFKRLKNNMIEFNYSEGLIELKIDHEISFSFF
jgi:hypothetical protein